MPYTSLAEIERQKALAQNLGSTERNRYDTSGLSGLAQVLNAGQASYLRSRASDAESENDRIKQQEMQQLMNAMSGAQAPMLPGRTPTFQHPDIQQMALAREIQNSQPQSPIPVGENTRLYDPVTQQVILDASPNPTNYNQPFLPDGTPNQAYQDYQTGLREAGRTSVNTTVNNPASNEFLEGIGSSQAVNYDELSDSATSAYRSNQSLDQFVAASANGDQGAFQPISTAAKNLIASFGYNPEGLTDVVVMEQAIGDILSNKMAELGARGLTDRDMQVLKDALPRVNTSQEARVNVANIVKKANAQTIAEFINQTNFIKETYPDFPIMTPSWFGTYEDLMSQADSIINSGQ